MYELKVDARILRIKFEEEKAEIEEDDEYADDGYVGRDDKEVDLV